MARQHGAQERAASAARPNPDRHLITGLLEEFAVCQRRLLRTISVVLKADWAAPLGFSAESVRSLVGCHGSDLMKGCWVVVEYLF